MLVVPLLKTLYVHIFKPLTLSSLVGLVKRLTSVGMGLLEEGEEPLKLTSEFVSKTKGHTRFQDFETYYAYFI